MRQQAGSLGLNTFWEARQGNVCTHRFLQMYQGDGGNKHQMGVGRPLNEGKGEEIIQMNQMLKLAFFLSFLYPIPTDLPSVPEYDKVSQCVAELLLFSPPTEFSHSYL